MKTKWIKSLLAAVGAAALLVGCSTSNQGGMGNETQYGGGFGAGYAAGDGGANGSFSHTNPLGLGIGTGITR
jgi:hypothetical protein